MKIRAPHGRRASALAVAAVTLAVSGGGVALAGTIDDQSSPNWAGWVALPTHRSTPRSARRFINVSGSWVQPSATCTPHRTTFAAFWVGLGGYAQHSKALEQVGTEADCSRYGVVFYYAWYELLPGPPITIHSIKVVPGDAVSASVHVSSDRVTVKLTDRTSGPATFVKSSLMRSPPPDTSAAEWIAEAPSNCTSDNDCKPLRLTDFGDIGFTAASATGIGVTGRHTGPINDPDWDYGSIVLSSNGSLTYTPGEESYAVPSTLSVFGSAFTVNYGTSTGPSGPTGASGATGATGTAARAGARS
jgi:hypothetical protein